jgi:hypothetical protein
VVKKYYNFETTNKRRKNMETYEELIKQRDYYKSVADKHNNLIDNAKFWIGLVIVILISSVEYDIVYEFIRSLL